MTIVVFHLLLLLGLLGLLLPLLRPGSCSGGVPDSLPIDRPGPVRPCCPRGHGSRAGCRHVAAHQSTSRQLRQAAGQTPPVQGVAGRASMATGQRLPDSGRVRCLSHGTIRVARNNNKPIATMTSAVPYFREVGTGPGVVCLHSNASSSAQWRPLMDSLAPTHLVLAPDLYGAGKSPDWHSDRVITLADEAALIEPVLQRAGVPFILVGHSHGAALALRIAVENPGRVRALVLYEPTLFSLIEADGPAPNDADGIRDAVSAAARALDAGDADAAAGHFIDYWTGPGSWAATPEARRPAIAASVRSVRRWAYALMTEPTPLAAFDALRLPVLLMTGDRSTAAAHGVARRLAKVLPSVTCVEIPGLGHMGPITHAQLVNAQIARFLLRPST